MPRGCDATAAPARWTRSFSLAPPTVPRSRHSMLTDLSDWVTDVIDKLGYVGVAMLVALENVFPPIPSEIVLPFAGFVARDGDANLVVMILAATIGSTIGALVLYGVAAAIGPERLHVFVVRYGKWFRLTPRDIEKAERWFD